MYISCSRLWEAGITKDKVSCCGSCHDDADEWPEDYGLIEIYPEDLGLPQEGRVVGWICCTVSHFLNDLPDKPEVLRKLYETDSLTSAQP